ncbi:hypothetical protein D0B03_07475 [Campylobacter upsaliensis]|uniref:Cpp45 n=1 Tax=Campylobacter upsaliensis TaxID=28080 RepID=A0A5L8ZAA6_CAMUP|nr:hypothetical protein [Campylobacter upsaliensis]
MKQKIVISTLLTSFLFASALKAEAIDLNKVKYLGGQQGDACGALLCLAGGVSGGACAPYIAKYFAIKLKKPHETATARRNFLNLCPTASLSGSDKKFDQWQNTILPNVDGACTKEELNRAEKSKTPLRTEEQYDSKGNVKIVSIYGYRINPLPTHSCQLLMNHEYFSKSIHYTCSKEFYEENDWNNGYTKEEISKGAFDSLEENLRLEEEKRIEISFLEWKKLPPSERTTQSFDNGDKTFYKYYKLEPIYFKKHFIKKDCWLVKDKVVVNK